MLLVSCKKDPSLWKIDNLNNNKIAVIGHGGSGVKYKYPMNSMNSLNTVLSKDVEGTEMDVQMTKDSVLVLYHNANLEDGTNCNGKISGYNWSKIKECKYKYPLVGKVNLISVNDFFAQQSNIKKYIFVFDTKVEVTDSEETLHLFANALYNLITKYNLEENCFIESYNTNFLKLLYSKNHKLKLFLHADHYQTVLDAKAEVNLFGLTMDRLKISKQEIEDAHKNNLRVAIFNLDTEQGNINGIEMNPDYMQTDKSDFLIGALK